jgi:tetratricopeptide (TPR) repeat protein
LQTEEKDDFQKAARLFKNAIDNLPHDKAPIIWAKLHRRLGYVYSSYGEVFKDTAGIEYAIHYYKTALEVMRKQVT